MTTDRRGVPFDPSDHPDEPRVRAQHICLDVEPFGHVGVDFPFTCSVGGAEITLLPDGTFLGDGEAFASRVRNSTNLPHDGAVLAWLVMRAIKDKTE